MAYYIVITNKIYLMIWKNTLHSLSSGKKRIQNNIHSMLQICMKNIKEQNIHMHRKKCQEYTPVCMELVMSGKYGIFVSFIFSCFPKFLQ